MLGIGVIIVQTADIKPSVGTFSPEDKVVGFLLVLVACVLSGLAGVWFEKVLKQSTNKSIYFRNFQLAGFTLMLGPVQIMWNNGADVFSEGLTHGFNHWSWAFIFCQALGGFLVAAVAKHADQIAKTFASSSSIILGSLIAYVGFGTTLQPQFWVGATLVITAVTLYAKKS